MNRLQPLLQRWRRDWPSWAVLTIVSAMVTWLMTLSIGALPSHVAEGAIAPYDIRADRHYVVVDDDATARVRADAAARVRPVYDWQTVRGAQALARVSRICDVVQDALRDDPSGTMTQYLGAIRTIVGVEVTELQWHQLLEVGAAAPDCKPLREPIDAALTAPILPDNDVLPIPPTYGYTMRRLVDSQVIDATEHDLEHWYAIRSISAVRADIVVRIHTKRLQSISLVIAELVVPTLARNDVLTDELRQQAADATAPVTESIRAGELLARRDEPYTAEQVRRLRALQEKKASGRWPIAAFGTWVLVGLLLWTFDFCASRQLRTYRVRWSDRALIGGLLVVLVILLRAGSLTSGALASVLPLQLPVQALVYALPFGACGMLLRLFFPTTTALVGACAFSVLAGLLFVNEASITLFAIVVNCLGIVAIVGADKRWLIFRAGMLMGCAGAVCAMGLHAMHATDIGGRFSLVSLAWCAVFAVAGGIVSSIVTLVLMPVAEAFGCLSDIKLLELANLNHPLLRELVIRAPGTYHHSHLVGILGEAAATSVGANALMVRVAAYYHDIGKMRKPSYFAENMAGGGSPHDRVSPHMSAMILAAHVKDGVDMAREHKLPQAVVDMIPQHHGTKRIGAFFERAKQLAETSGADVVESDYRYPGPKPQTREAGIMMLADGVEGAVRALSEKTSARIDQTVQAILNKSFADGQLDECELTLKDLHHIGKAFTRILTGIYHQRVEYPREVLQLASKDVQVLDDAATHTTDATR